MQQGAGRWRNGVKCLNLRMMRKLKLICLVLCFAALCQTAAAGSVESSLSCRRFTTLDALPQMQTETVWQDSRGYIYVGTLSGFVRYDGVKMTPFLKGKRENIVAFQEVDGQVCALGFVRRWSVEDKEARMSQIDPQGQLLLNNLNSTDLPQGYILLEDRQEQNRVLCRLEAGGYSELQTSPLFDEMTPDRKLFLDQSGLYLPTPYGLYLLQDGQERILSGKDDVFSLCRSGDKLFALAADGIYRVQDDTLALVESCRFDSPDYGLSVRCDRHGDLYIADSHTIWLYDDGAPVAIRQLASGFNLIKGVFIDKWNRLWAATYQGAYCFFHCDFVNHRLLDKNDIVRAVAVCDGHLVCGTLNGSVLVDGREISALDGNFYAPGAATIGDKVYMAGNGDVACIQGDSVHWLGLPHDRYRFVARASDKLIIGTGRTLFSYDPASRQLDTLTAEIVRPWCVAEDGQGRLWVSGNPGLYCITGYGQEETVVRKVKNTPTSLVITALSSDGNGLVCYALGDALFVIRDGEERAMDEVQPFLSGHEIRSVHVSPQGCLVVAAIDGLLVARIDNRGRAANIHWFDAGNGFTSIEPLQGEMAEDEDGTVWLAGIEEMTSFRPEDVLADNQQSTIVESPRPWWQRWWSWVIAAVLLSFASWRAARRVEQRSARKKMAELEREKRQMELQLQAVRLKAIPHFHANVLSAIEYFVMNKSADEASHYLKLYSDFTNQTLSNIDSPSRPVADEVDYVRAYLDLERLRFGDRLQYNITVASDVDTKTMLPTMLLHTYSQNAVKHGIASKAGVGNVDVKVTRQVRDSVDGVLVSVRDDGVGRAEAARSGGYSTGQGLGILGQQIDLYNRTNKHKIVQKVTDLTDEGGRPAGTCFETWVPLDYQF